MVTTRQLLSRLLLAVVTFTVAFTMVVMLPADGWAADYQGNQSINQPASLVAPEPDAEIAVYPQPEAGQRQVGYGANGDAVTILEQVSDNQSTTWSHIHFDNPPHAEGWVQAEFVLTADANGQSQRTAGGNRYLGNQQFKSGQFNGQFNEQKSPSSSQSGAQSYSQRQN